MKFFMCLLCPILMFNSDVNADINADVNADVNANLNADVNADDNADVFLFRYWAKPLSGVGGGCSF